MPGNRHGQAGGVILIHELSRDVGNGRSFNFRGYRLRAGCRGENSRGTHYDRQCARGGHQSDLLQGGATIYEFAHRVTAQASGFDVWSQANGAIAGSNFYRAIRQSLNI